MSLVASHARALDHERECQRAVNEALGTLPDEARSGAEHHKTLDLCAHLLASRTCWLARIGGGTDRKEDWFPTGWTAEEIASRTEEVYEAWSDYLDELTDAELQRAFPYTSWEGNVFENRIEDVVVQLEGHSYYHRGQISQLIRRLGGQPPETDYVLLTRRAVT